MALVLHHLFEAALKALFNKHVQVCRRCFVRVLHATLLASKLKSTVKKKRCM